MKFLILLFELNLTVILISRHARAEVKSQNRNISEIESLNTYLNKITSSLSKISNVLESFLDYSKTNQSHHNSILNECDTELENVTSSAEFAELEYKDGCICAQQPQPCTKMWNISTSPGAKIEVELNDLEMKGEGKCSIKSLKIYDDYNNNNDKKNNNDNYTSKPLYTSCTNFPPANIISKDNYIIIVTEVTEITTLPSFKFRHRKVILDEPALQIVQIKNKIALIMAQNDISTDSFCSEDPKVLTADYGIIYSPNYQFGYKYPNEASCTWLITVDPGKIVVLTIITFALENEFPFTKQCFDFVKIYDSAQPDRSKLFGTYCGSDALRPPKTVRSTSNQMLILFESDEATNDMGFAAKYASVALVPTTTANPKEHKPPTCGKPVVQPKPYNRIVGGVEAIAHSWPWMVSVRVASAHSCGGVLINQDWVVTAAHCLVDFNIDLLDVALGEHNNSFVEGTEEFRNIKKMVIHKDYSAATCDSDIGLLRLVKPVSMNDYIQPICLRKMPYNSKLTCVVCGWGRTRDTGSEAVLNQLLVPMIDVDMCSSWYHNYFTKNMLCAGYAEGGRDSCQGDSGGPLVCSDGKMWHLAGVTSWGFDCAKPRKPGVYTNVTVFLDWIISNAVD